MERTLVVALCALLVCVSAPAAELPPANTTPRAPPPELASAPAATGAAVQSAGAARADRAAAGEGSLAPAADAANKIDPAQVKQVQVSVPSDRTVCRKEEPTGSRIAVKRCYSTAETASGRLQNEILQRDVEEMRNRQIYDQLRRASLGTMPTVMPPRQ